MVTHKILAQHSKEVADVIAVASVAGAGTTLLTQVDQIISILAGLSAIIAASVSVYMHCTRRKRNKRKEKDTHD